MESLLDSGACLLAHVRKGSARQKRVRALIGDRKLNNRANPHASQSNHGAASEQAFGKRRVSCRISASRSGGMADAADSKSVGRKAVWVRLPPPAYYLLV